jgi:acyl-CoA dehydrogenase
MLGGMARAFELTLEHLKTRVQFGVPIGSFQALKHRAANCFMEIELARSCVLAAVRALDEGDAEARRLVSLAKARCSDGFVLVANEGVQMFGGVGMTDEYDIGFYLKRARAAELTFGDAAFHRGRWAALGSY